MIIQTITVLAKSKNSNLISENEYFELKINLGYDSIEDPIYFSHELNDINDSEDLFIGTFDTSGKFDTFINSFERIMSTENYDKIDNPHLYTLNLVKTELKKIQSSIKNQVNNIPYSDVVDIVNRLKTIIVEY
jgi:hypothetical protein